MEEWIASHARPIVDSIVYSLLGCVILGTSFWAIVRILPFSAKKEIEEDHNTAFAVILAAFILGLSFIISSAIRG
ncbi:MAG: DUF350 domain-containing protein [Vicinamibacteria bacterium]|nr:DUF350 domain-containing protein [Vicinamibacteria bacterium]